MSAPPPLQLHVEPTAAAPSIARLFVAEAARTAGLDEESVGELRLAVSEVVTAAVEDGRPVRVGIDLDADGLSVVLPWLPASSQGPIDRRRILSSLGTVGFSLDGEVTILHVERRRVDTRT